MEEFNLNKAPLDGKNLIEAGAGTGKTYNIAGLYVRLILEKKLQTNEILVVTFTKAATEELKDRIRKKIRQTMAALVSGRSDDPSLAELIRNIPDKNEAKRRLRSALRGFDEAAIFTIHGFCQRILHDNAFESGGLFDTELITDQGKLLQEVVDDFWRKHFSEASLPLLNYVRSIKSDYIASPGKLLKLVGKLYARPFLKVIPPVKIPETRELEKRYQTVFKIVQQAWPAVKNDVESTLKDGDQLKRNIYKKDSVILWLKQMDIMLSANSSNPVLFDKFHKLTTGEIEKGCKKNCKPPDLPFFGRCDKLLKCSLELCAAYDQYLLALKTELFEYIGRELAVRKLEKNIQYYDDLLSGYKAALIDEFQDTDPLQYDIFKTIYSKPDSVLFLIGDPKQAIYGFRGADIFAYMKAIDQVDRRYTLTENWRSEPGLISATNEIFSGAPKPFIYDKIPFIPAVPAEDDNRKILLINGETRPQFNFWFIDSSHLEEVYLTKGFISKNTAYDLLTRAIISEVSNLLIKGDKNKITTGNRALQAGDIAILVRTNNEAQMVKDALAENKIPCVLFSTKNVFGTDEAEAAERLLTAIANPGNEILAKAALTSNIIGLSGEEIFDIEQDSNRWEIWLRQFKDYNEIWGEYGFITMFSRLLSDLEVRSRFLSLPDGERRLTNILHITEILHRQASENKLGITGLVKWLVLQKSPDVSTIEYHQLRLESDDNAVKIVTIHKSKGLEYPIVFYPFAWGDSRLNKNRDNIFHNVNNDNELTLDLESKNYDSNKNLAEKELMAENLRLLYVALTRARHRCYLAWGKFNQAGSSALAWLLHQPIGDDLSNIVQAAENHFKELDESEIRIQLEKYSERTGGAIKLSPLPAGPDIEYVPARIIDHKLYCRKFSGSIDYLWRISSFSHLISGKTRAIELPDHDASLPDTGQTGLDEEQPISAEKPSGIFLFPKGAIPGTFCHDLFEHLDFKNIDNSQTTELAGNKLKAYGFDVIWQETIIDMVKKVLTTRLSSDSDLFNLSQIDSKDRLNELEFYFPLKTLTPEKLRNVFIEHGETSIAKDFPETIGRLNFSPVKGFMKGYIDLVFRYHDRYYIVDWKSNHLGNKSEDYSREKLAWAMAKSFYTLQYHIYTVALNKYLSLRHKDYNYEAHFGGVFYIFLRGVDPELGNDNGVFYDKPSADLIGELSQLLIDETWQS